MKPDLSSIIDDLVTGKARLRDDLFLHEAAAGAAIAVNFFTCPPRTLRLILAAVLDATKTTGTALQLFWYNPQTQTGQILINRTIGTDIIAIPTDDGSDKDEAEMSANAPWLMKPGEYLTLTHALTAGEIITDYVGVKWIEWSGVNVR